MKIEIGRPEHGWVDVRFSDSPFILEDSVSDVPCDFVHHTVLALSRMMSGAVSQEVELSLEPDFCVMLLEREGEVLSMDLSIRRDGQQQTRRIHKTSGSFGEIVLPIYRAVKSFYSYKSAPPHWPECDSAELENLTRAIKAHRYQQL